MVWLTGVRRTGKTTLAQALPDVACFDCELPRIRRVIEEDPEGFLGQNTDRRVVLDEVHRVANPSELLKIAADHFPAIRVLATGSSTLGASMRFRDTLTGRKRQLHLAPVLFSELGAFGLTDLERRLLHGGLPENLLAAAFPEKEFAEWMDAYWARDIQELFRLEKRTAFLRLFELLLRQSGGLCELNQSAAACGASRQTLANYLGATGRRGRCMSCVRSPTTRSAKSWRCRKYMGLTQGSCAMPGAGGPCAGRTWGALGTPGARRTADTVQPVGGVLLEGQTEARTRLRPRPARLPADRHRMQVEAGGRTGDAIPLVPSPLSGRPAGGGRHRRGGTAGRAAGRENRNGAGASGAGGGGGWGRKLNRSMRLSPDRPDHWAPTPLVCWNRTRVGPFEPPARAEPQTTATGGGRKAGRRPLGACTPRWDWTFRPLRTPTGLRRAQAGGAATMAPTLPKDATLPGLGRPAGVDPRGSPSCPGATPGCGTPPRCGWRPCDRRMRQDHVFICAMVLAGLRTMSHRGCALSGPLFRMPMRCL